LWWEIVEEIVTRCERIALPAAAGGGWLACGTPAEKRRADAVLTEFLTCRIGENEQGRALRELAGAAGIEVEATGRKLLMNWEEIGRIAAHPLAAIGAHSVSHFNLRRLSDEAAWQEITAPIEILERRLGVRPRHMAYPYGFAAAVGPREVRMAKEAGFRTAVTTRHGVVHAAHASHLHALPRISLNGRYQRIAYLGTMLSGITTPMANYGRRLVTV
jgi:peptidoglycan/xylan/chitin deacetylase (PgdA/CDA1 family)